MVTRKMQKTTDSDKNRVKIFKLNIQIFLTIFAQREVQRITITITVCC